jgi:chitinase
MKDWGFDGIDIDWEFPASDTEAANFVLLLQAIRQAMDAYAAQYASGYHFILSTASPAGPAHYGVLHLSEMDAYLDVWNLMAYDYSGSWGTVSGHQANLYPSTSNPTSTPFSTDGAVKDYIAAGVTPCKILLGMPIYGRSFDETAGLGQNYTGVGVGTWQAGVWDYKDLPRVNATVLYDAEAGASYSYDAGSQELISYDTVCSVEIKSSYVQTKGMGGAAFWELSADGNGTASLVSAAAGVLKIMQQETNLLSYPNSQYANIVAGMPGE